MGFLEKVKEVLLIDSTKGLLTFVGALLIMALIMTRTYIVEVCKEDQYEKTKGVYKRFAVDGNGNSGMNFEFVVGGQIYEGFSLESGGYSVTNGDTLIIEYCSDTKSVSEVDFEDEYMQKYKSE